MNLRKILDIVMYTHFNIYPLSHNHLNLIFNANSHDRQWYQKINKTIVLNHDGFLTWWIKNHIYMLFQSLTAKMHLENALVHEGTISSSM